MKLSATTHSFRWYRGSCQQKISNASLRIFWTGRNTASNPRWEWPVHVLAGRNTGSFVAQSASKMISALVDARSGAGTISCPEFYFAESTVGRCIRHVSFAWTT